ncbi:MAG: hypothetical protein IT438_13480 [Phycisphaerales bacterium]|nr:hypothetical protein [Phycisphaerales bacterium]
MRLRSEQGLLTVALAATLGLGAGAPAQTSQTDRAQPDRTPAAAPMTKRKVLHLRLKGDLDCMKLVDDLAAATGEARKSGVEVIVLEMSGERWRGDVVSGMMPLFKGAEVLTIAWLNDPPDGRVGSGQAALALLADRCYIGPKTEVVFEPGHDLRAQAPPTTNWEQVEQDVQAALWGRLGSVERPRDTLLAAALPTPRQPLWAILDRSPGLSGARLERLVAESPSAAEAGRFVSLTSGSTERGELRLRVEPAMAVSIGIAESSARELGQILAAERLTPAPLTRAELESGLAKARQELVKDLAAFDRAAERMDKALDDAEKQRGVDAARRKRKVGKESLPLGDEAAKSLEAVEALVANYPELLRSAPPGVSTVELTAVRLSAAWHDAVQDRKDRLVELRARATRLAE